MSKERLEEMNKLKNIINSLDDSADADDFHKFVDTCQINYEEGVFNEILRFMQSQAERVQELEGERDEWRDTSQSYYMTNQELRGQNKRYREALEFYADEENYFFDEKEYRVGLGVPESEITIDYGQKARKSLRGE